LQFYEEVTDKLAAAGLVEDQAAVYSQWLARDPRNARAAYRLGLLQAVYNPLQAVTYLSLAKSLDGSFGEGADPLLDTLAGLQDADERYRLVLVGRTLGNLGEWAIARQAFQKAVDLDPEYGDAWAFLGESLQHLGKPALKALETANQLSPDSIGVKTLTAMYWQRQNKPERALEIMQQIADLRPGEYVWLIEMGNIAADAGDLKSALVYINQAVDAEPDNPQWRKALVTLCLKNNYEVRSLGLPAARQYLQLAGESADALSLMGSVMLNLQDTLSAERYLSRSLQQDPANPGTHLQLAQVYLMESKPVQAYNHLNAVLANAPAQSETAQMAARLIKKYFPDGAPGTP
ncbi:MAG: tetratricopeptide repeat protein, partial [Anaerolineaceae bacterium]